MVTGFRRTNSIPRTIPTMAARAIIAPKSHQLFDVLADGSPGGWAGVVEGLLPAAGSGPMPGLGETITGAGEDGAGVAGGMKAVAAGEAPVGSVIKGCDVEDGMIAAAVVVTGGVVVTAGVVVIGGGAAAVVKVQTKLPAVP